MLISETQFKVAIHPEITNKLQRDVKSNQSPNQINGYQDRALHWFSETSHNQQL